MRISRKSLLNFSNLKKAVIQRIMNDSPQPIPERYDESIKHLVINMLTKDPNERSDINKIISNPFVQKQVLFH